MSDRGTTRRSQVPKTHNVRKSAAFENLSLSQFCRREVLFNAFMCTLVLKEQSNSACLPRIRAKIVDPYNKIVARITQLARLQVSLPTHLRMIY